MSEELKELRKITKKIEREAIEILRRLKPYLTCVKNENGDEYEELSEEFRRQYPNIEPAIGISLFQDILLDLIDDSITIVKEIPLFLDNISKGIGLDSLDDDCFIKRVWFGDIYETEGIESLKSLYDDFKTQRKLCNAEEIVRLCCKDLGYDRNSFEENQYGETIDMEVEPNDDE